MTGIRARDLEVGDVFTDSDDDDKTTVAVLDYYGDAVLILTGDGGERSFDGDEVVELVELVSSPPPVLADEITDDTLWFVEWSIELPAGSAEDAARAALETMQDPDSTAVVFVVSRFGITNSHVEVDLLDPTKRDERHDA